MPTQRSHFQPRRARHRRHVVALLIAACLWRGSPVAAAETTAQDLQLAFLFNFAKFTEWPAAPAPDPGAPFVIGILGEWPDAVSPGTLGDRTIHGRRVRLVHLRAKDDPRDCQVLFFHRPDPDELARTLGTVRTAAVLTVGDSDDFLEDGGIIRLVMAEGGLRFEVNLEHAEAAHLKLNSSLLALARKVAGRKNTP